MVQGRTTFLHSLLGCTPGIPVSASGLDRDPAVHPASECRKLYFSSRCRPKKNGKLKLIQLLAAPVEHSITDGISKKDYSLHYVTVKDAITIIMHLGQLQGYLLATINIREVFRLSPVQPADYHLWGITWQVYYYYDRVLPFSLRSAPFISIEPMTPFNKRR